MPVLSATELRAVMERNGASGFLAKVMVAGALAESGGDTDAIGDEGHSVGIFQLHDHGLGHGMTVAQRKDPDLSAQRMREPYATGLRAANVLNLVGEDRAAKSYIEAERPAGYPDIHCPAAIKFRACWRTLGEWDLSDALVTQANYLTGDVAAALQNGLNGARHADANPPPGRQDAYGAIQAAINTLRDSGPALPGTPAADLINLVGFLMGTVAQALQNGLHGALATDDDPPADRRAAYDAIQAAINTLRRGGAPV